VSANITGTIFHIEDRAAGLAIGAEHRLYDGVFNPDPLRQIGESQDSLAFPVSASYHVNEVYTELSLPLLKSLGASAAVRYSDYSTFGSRSKTLPCAAPTRLASALRIWASCTDSRSSELRWWIPAVRPEE
jgi:hypothetical protein